MFNDVLSTDDARQGHIIINNWKAGNIFFHHHSYSLIYRGLLFNISHISCHNGLCFEYLHIILLFLADSRKNHISLLGNKIPITNGNVKIKIHNQRNINPPVADKSRIPDRQLYFV